MNRLLLALPVALLTALPARADMAPLEPFTKYASPTHRIETRLDIRNYTFVVEFSNMGRSLPAGSEFVVPDASGAITVVGRGGNRESAELSLVWKAEADPYQTAESLVAALKAGRVRPVARHTFEFREQVPSWSAKPVVTYELRQGTTHNELVIVRTGRGPMWQWTVAAVLATAGVVVGGVWFVRWFFRAPRGLAPAAEIPPPPGPV